MVDALNSKYEANLRVPGSAEDTCEWEKVFKGVGLLNNWLLFHLYLEYDLQIWCYNIMRENKDINLSLQIPPA